MRKLYPRPLLCICIDCGKIKIHFGRRRCKECCFAYCDRGYAKRNANWKYVEVDHRLKSLALIEKGWLDGEGEALDADDIEKLRAIMQVQYRRNWPFPYLYPTPEGGISMEWETGGYLCGMTIDLQAQMGDFHACSRDMKEIEDSSICCFLDLNEKESWNMLDRLLKIGV